MKIERTRIHFSATFSLPSPSSHLKAPIFLAETTEPTKNSTGHAPCSPDSVSLYKDQVQALVYRPTTQIKTHKDATGT